VTIDGKLAKYSIEGHLQTLIEIPNASLPKSFAIVSVLYLKKTSVNTINSFNSFNFRVKVVKMQLLVTKVENSLFLILKLWNFNIQLMVSSLHVIDQMTNFTFYLVQSGLINAIEFASENQILLASKQTIQLYT
jgi:hypothetical protein